MTGQSLAVFATGVGHRFREEVIQLNGRLCWPGIAIFEKYVRDVYAAAFESGKRADELSRTPTPSAPSVPDYHPAAEDWTPKPAAPLTMRQLLDTLATATDAERREFSKWWMDLPTPHRPLAVGGVYDLHRKE